MKSDMTVHAVLFLMVINETRDKTDPLPGLPINNIITNWKLLSIILNLH